MKVLNIYQEKLKTNNMEFKIGMRFNNTYLHGAGNRDGMDHEGIIEFVAVDYFVLRDLDENKPYLIRSDDFYCVEKDDLR